MNTIGRPAGANPLGTFLTQNASSGPSGDLGDGRSLVERTGWCGSNDTGSGRLVPDYGWRQPLAVRGSDERTAIVGVLE